MNSPGITPISSTGAAIRPIQVTRFDEFRINSPTGAAARPISSTVSGAHILYEYSFVFPVVLVSTQPPTNRIDPNTNPSMRRRVFRIYFHYREIGAEVSTSL